MDERGYQDGFADGFRDGQKSAYDEIGEFIESLISARTDDPLTPPKLGAVDFNRFTRALTRAFDGDPNWDEERPRA